MKPFVITLLLIISARFNLYAGDFFQEVRAGADSWEVTFHEQGSRYRIEIDSIERGTSGYRQRLRLLPKETLRLIDKHEHMDIKRAERAGKMGVEITRSYRDRLTGDQKTELIFEPNHPAKTIKPEQGADGQPRSTPSRNDHSTGIQKTVSE